MCITSVSAVLTLASKILCVPDEYYAHGSKLVCQFTISNKTVNAQHECFTIPQGI